MDLRTGRERLRVQVHVLDFNFLTLKMTQVCIVAKVTSDYQLMVAWWRRWWLEETINH